MSNKVNFELFMVSEEVSDFFRIKKTELTESHYLTYLIYKNTTNLTELIDTISRLVDVIKDSQDRIADLENEVQEWKS